MPRFSIDQKRILITGAGGFIGSRLAQSLIEQGGNVYAWVRSPRIKPDRWPIRKNLHVINGDILNEHFVRKTCSKIRPQIIFHFAAYGNHPEHYQGKSFGEQLLEMTRINVLGFANLLAALETTDFECLVSTGSAFAESGPSQEKFREELPLNPDTFYGSTKAAATLIAQAYAAVCGKRIVILKPTYVYGPGEGIDRFIPTAIRAGLEGKRLKLTSLKECKDFVYIDDVLEAYRKALVKAPKGVSVFNIGSSKETTFGEVLKLIERNIGKKIYFEEGRYQSLKWVGNWAASIEKAKKILGWKPKTSLEEGIRKSVQSVLSRKPFLSRQPVTSSR